MTLPKNTKEVLSWFEKLSAVPRPSDHEEKMRDWLLSWAKEHSFTANEDKTGNIVIKVPGSKGFEKSPVIVLQGHMDMVCEKTPESKHDFSTDPIRFVYDGDWLKADRTTLGADNGIALALAMAFALDKNVSRPPLELLFTVAEETGLTGANNLEPGFIEGKILLNLDSEDEGVFTVGCAGGLTSTISIPINRQKPCGGCLPVMLKVGSLKGGHSGVDIKLGRGNAIKILTRALAKLDEKIGVKVSDLKGGSAHNVIPRSAEAVILMGESRWSEATKVVLELENTIKNEYAVNDSELFISIEKAPKDDGRQVLSDESTKLVINTLQALPHGVYTMSTAIEGLVETSNNVATVKISGDSLEIQTSQRSSLMSRIEEISSRIVSVAKLAGGTVKNSAGYPPWEANWKSSLLKTCKEIYKKRFGKDPVVEVIHAGLECGIIGAKYHGMDMISFGPTIKNPHSPDERVKVSDIEKIWDLMIEIFKAFK